jgi:hypothetical protein
MNKKPNEDFKPDPENEVTDTEVEETELEKLDESLITPEMIAECANGKGDGEDE